MKIIIAGASGFVGKALVSALKKEGHTLYLLTRGPSQPEAGKSHWDPEHGEIDRKILEGSDVWINLAGENIAGRRWTEKYKEKILNSRVKGTRLIAETAATLEKPPKVIINASATGYYGDRGEEILTEESAPGKGFLANVCQQWEAALDPAEAQGIRVVKMRFGVVLGKEGGFLKQVTLPFKLCLGGVIGSGKQWMSWVALEDLVQAVLFVINEPSCQGVYNVVAPHPVTNKEFTTALGKTLHRPTIFPLPAGVARVVFGEMADALMLSSTRVLPVRLERSGFIFRDPEIKHALR